MFYFKYLRGTAAGAALGLSVAAAAACRAGGSNESLGDGRSGGGSAGTLAGGASGTGGATGGTGGAVITGGSAGTGVIDPTTMPDGGDCTPVDCEPVGGKYCG